MALQMVWKERIRSVACKEKKSEITLKSEALICFRLRVPRAPKHVNTSTPANIAWFTMVTSILFEAEQIEL